MVVDGFLSGTWRQAGARTLPGASGLLSDSWKEQQTLIVPDVEQFPGHIACSSLSRSEIVVPVFDETGEVCAVLDIDSKDLGCFDETDRHYLELAMRSIPKVFFRI